MTAPDDLKVYEAIYEAGDNGLTSDELAERFEVDKWDMHDVCLKLKRDGLVTTRGRLGTGLIVFVRREHPHPPEASTYLGGPAGTSTGDSIIDQIRAKRKRRRDGSIEPFI